ncbi:MAG: hypothetical protein ACK4VI_02275 [Alphaproteobacteria bacterium]
MMKNNVYRTSRDKLIGAFYGASAGILVAEVCFRLAKIYTEYPDEGRIVGGVLGLATAFNVYRTSSYGRAFLRDRPQVESQNDSLGYFKGNHYPSTNVSR